MVDELEERFEAFWMRSPTGPAVPWRVIAAFVVGIALYEVGRSAVPEVFRLWLNLAAGGALVMIAARVGLGVADLGLERARLRRGLLWGGAAFVGLGLAVAIVGAFSPDSLTSDKGYESVTGGEAAFKVFVRIPLGTALFEEVVFRSVLLGLLLRNLRPLGATLLSSVLFGLWHIVPNVEKMVDVGTIARDVGFTFLAGLVFAWLLLGSRSVLAPTLMHWGSNGWAYGIGWLIVENNWSGVT